MEHNLDINSKQELSTQIFKSIEIKKYLKNIFNLKNIQVQSSSIFFTKNSLQIYVTVYKGALIITQCKEKELKLITKSISSYLKNKYSIVLKLYFINLKPKTLLCFCDKNQIKKVLLSLRPYHRYDIFNETIQTLIIMNLSKNSAYLLSSFISNQLLKAEQHSYHSKILGHSNFLLFLKKTLTCFSDFLNSNIRGIKIQIKGKIKSKKKRVPRAQKKEILIKQVPTKSFNAKISYSKSTCFSTNGTLGIKVWIYTF